MQYVGIEAFFLAADSVKGESVAALDTTHEIHLRRGLPEGVAFFIEEEKEGSFGAITIVP
ncbi:hypothetical protein EDC63_1434 [Sulfurirhabdus autotrophica]|uniref:Uncharacterized protein n=2 Tax=Sulfurirhabdus autotrophica TaxID=1706046 RepID=A0A4R3XS98_9PROT|nr:hypothetical protein EDC63_1434 [Sulfurirhabdus autotrophica]